MKILAIDTSSKICSVAIVEDTKILIELHSNDERTHSIKLMPMIDEAFKKTNLSLDNIDLLACSVGPGSFTGIRIGIATIKAFADAKNIPVVSVNSLEVLASAVENNTNSLVCPLLDARNHNVYAGIFLNNILCGDLLADDLDNVLENIKNIADNKKIENIFFVGDATELYADVLKDINYNVNILDNSYYINGTSTNIANIAIKKYKNGKYGNSSILSPLYLRKSQAERELEKRNEKQD